MPFPSPARHARPIPDSAPGSDGEHELQQELGTTERARRFYDDQVLDHLNPRMRDFVRAQRMMFVATADSAGECDSTFRAGPPGFVQVLDEKTLAWPEYRGNGVMASLGNIRENPHVGLLMVDFTGASVGLHVNGRARVVPADQMPGRERLVDADPRGRLAALWVQVTVDEAYIHCSKHIPRLIEVDPARQERPVRTTDYFAAGTTKHPGWGVGAAS